MRLVFLGGFLGSGKTTTLLRLAADLAKRGHSVGVLTNDQGEELVDTELFRAAGFATRDVRGGCFCCRLDDFIDQAKTYMSASKPDFLLAEPVGSCTDLVATVLRPLRQLFPDDFEIGPYTVLVDPLLARNALSRDGTATLSEKVTYIYRLQQMEADAIAINKADLLLPDELANVTSLLRTQFPAPRVLSFSARTGEGFDELMTWLLGSDRATLRRSPDIDYDDYAAAEAELAWFDGRFALTAREPIAMDEALLRLGALLRERLVAANLTIAHVKLFLRAGESVCALSLPRGDVEPELTRASHGLAVECALIVNARVAAQPAALAAVVQRCLYEWAEGLAGSLREETASSFSPARPVPTQRID